MSALRRVVWTVVVLGGLAGGAYGVFLWQKSSAAANEPKFKTIKADRSTIAAKVTATGTLSARTTVQVGSQVSGRLSEVLVDWNNEVKKGQVLARIDTRVFKAALDRSQATYASATAGVVKAKANALQARRVYERTKKLMLEGLANQIEVDQAEATFATTNADISVAAAQVRSAAASVSEAELNLSFTTIVSPIDGIVLSRAVDVGQTVAASLQSPVLFTIAQDLRNIQVDTFIAEADVAKLKTGMDASFTVDAYPGKRFVGKVREVRNAATTVQNVVTYDAVLDVSNEKLELKPGMTANVTFIFAERVSVVSVPNAALRYRPSPDLMPSGSARNRGGAGGAGSGRGKDRGGAPGADKGSKEDIVKRTVWKLKDGRPAPLFVETGLTDGTMTEIISGLTEGEELITDVIVVSEGATRALGATTAAGGGGRRGF